MTKWLVFTGQTIGAEEAGAIGLVDRVVPYEGLDSAIAEVIAGGRPAERAPRPVPDSHRRLATFFDSHDPESLWNGSATLPEDARLIKAVTRVSSKAPIALRLAAELIDRGATLPLDEGLRLELAHVREIFSTKDAYEGLSSLGKRPPVFTAHIQRHAATPAMRRISVS